MRQVPVSELVPGMITVDDIYNYNDQLVLPGGYVLNDKAIIKLAFYSIPFIRIQDSREGAAPVRTSQFIQESSYSHRIKTSPEFQIFQSTFETTVDDFKASINDVVEKNAPLDVDQLMKDTLSLLEKGRNSINIFDMLHNMRQYDDLTFTHCINVSLICNVFARWLGMSDEDIHLATQCGLFHDIGKLKIPEDIIKKPSRLTDYEYKIIKTHPFEGYNILKEQDLNPHVANAALMHHERCDGFGYPLGITAEKIDPFAKMVAIADVYDAMTATRVYRGPMCPFKVISVFESEGLQRYDARMIMTFLENVTNTYMLNHVRLSDGREGEIVMINRLALSRPMIRSGNQYINLADQPSTLYIEELL
ncbi:MAG: HD-GYP domain-containing protein [Lachnospiraceae bacterium]|nr:HD-GYP domain-containing protein [Lachnospiraceae bacterium]